VGKTSKRPTSLGVRGLCARLVSHQSREVQVIRLAKQRDDDQSELYQFISITASTVCVTVRTPRTTGSRLLGIRRLWSRTLSHQGLLILLPLHTRVRPILFPPLRVEGKSLVGHPEDDSDYAEPLSTRPHTPSKVVTVALYALYIATVHLAVANYNLGTEALLERMITDDETNSSLACD